MKDKNKKGLSSIVTTLIIILLVLVALGIVWAVMSGIIEGGAASVDYGSKCLRADVRATAVVFTTGTSYDVTLNRRAGGDSIDGVKLVFFSPTANSAVIDQPGNIQPLATVKKTAVPGGITGANRIEVTPYFKDSSGKEQLCSTVTYRF